MSQDAFSGKCSAQCVLCLIMSCMWLTSIRHKSFWAATRTLAKRVLVKPVSVSLAARCFKSRAHGFENRASMGSPLHASLILIHSPPQRDDAGSHLHSGPLHVPSLISSCTICPPCLTLLSREPVVMSGLELNEGILLLQVSSRCVVCR